MNFEIAYKKYVEGTASPEEVAFVEAEIEKSKQLTEIIDRVDSAKPVIAPSDIEDVKKAKKRFTVKSAVRIAVITLAVLVVAAGAICGGVFGTVASSAKSNAKVSMDDAKSIAVQYVHHNMDVTGKQVYVNDRECEKDINYASPLTKSHYIYEIEVQCADGRDWDLTIDSQNGMVINIDD